MLGDANTQTTGHTEVWHISNKYIVEVTALLLCTAYWHYCIWENILDGENFDEYDERYTIC